MCRLSDGKLEVQHEIKGEFEVMCPYLNQQGEMMVHALRRERNGNEVSYIGNCYNMETAKQEWEMAAHAPVGKESKIRLNGSAMVFNRQTSHVVSCFNSKTLLFVDPISRRSLRLTIEDLKGATPAVMTAVGN